MTAQAQKPLDLDDVYEATAIETKAWLDRIGETASTYEGAGLHADDEEIAILLSLAEVASSYRYLYQQKVHAAHILMTGVNT